MSIILSDKMGKKGEMGLEVVGMMGFIHNKR
jgi:hypothetical protein